MLIKPASSESLAKNFIKWCYDFILYRREIHSATLGMNAEGNIVCTVFVEPYSRGRGTARGSQMMQSIVLGSRYALEGVSWHNVILC